MAQFAKAFNLSTPSLKYKQACHAGSHALRGMPGIGHSAHQAGKKEQR
jgi:hypothetical protein